MNPLRKLMTLMFLVPLASSAAYAAPKYSDKGWWIIVASFRTCGSDACGSESHGQELEGLARPCDLRIFNDFSNKFSGFDSGYNVYLIDQIFSKSKARKALARAKNCFPDAYMKSGRYMGE